VPDDIRPLGRVYFDGRGSYHPDGAAIAAYRWRVLEFPPGADASAFDLQGEATPLADMYLPLAGHYAVRLTVTDGFGVESGVSLTSDVPFDALPDSRLHVQLVWDSPTRDLDLHLVNADRGDFVYSDDSDCHWINCRPSCGTPADDDCVPVQWFTAYPPFTEGNGRLDIDDTAGLGPENINIDRPEAGRYRIYVHFYGLVDPTDEATQATVRVYLDGVLRGEFRRLLHVHDLWRVAEIQWFTEAPATLAAATSDREGQVGAVKQLGYQPYPSGYSFGGTF